MNRIWPGLLDALGAAGSMTWQVTWSLILGFTLSAIVQALVRKSSGAGRRGLHSRPGRDPPPAVEQGERGVPDHGRSGIHATRGGHRHRRSAG